MWLHNEYHVSFFLTGCDVAHSYRSRKCKLKVDFCLNLSVQMKSWVVWNSTAFLWDRSDTPQVDFIFDRFFIKRIGLRFLIQSPDPVLCGSGMAVAWQWHVSLVICSVLGPVAFVLSVGTISSHLGENPNHQLTNFQYFYRFFNVPKSNIYQL